MASKDYKTLKSSAQDEYIDRKSRFIGCAAPCESEEAALAFLKSVRERYKDASHHCYAYIIGENAGIMRYSDDGEPGGTAGMPIIEVMKARGVVNCCVVVVRYFGGILLGAGGLTRAYSHSCAIALNAAQVVRMECTRRVLLDVPYPMWDKVNYALKSLPQITEETSFGVSVSCTVLVRERDVGSVLQSLTSLTDGKIEALETDELHYPWPEEA